MFILLFLQLSFFPLHLLCASGWGFVRNRWVRNLRGRKVLKLAKYIARLVLIMHKYVDLFWKREIFALILYAKLDSLFFIFSLDFLFAAMFHLCSQLMLFFFLDSMNFRYGCLLWWGWNCPSFPGEQLLLSEFIYYYYYLIITVKFHIYFSFKCKFMS